MAIWVDLEVCGIRTILLLEKSLAWGRVATRILFSILSAIGHIKILIIGRGILLTLHQSILVCVGPPRIRRVTLSSSRGAISMIHLLITIIHFHIGSYISTITYSASIVVLIDTKFLFIILAVILIIWSIIIIKVIPTLPILLLFITLWLKHCARLLRWRP